MRKASELGIWGAMVLAGILTAACSRQEDGMLQAETGEPVELAFVMYKGSAEEELTEEQAPGTRATGNAGVDVEAGRLLTIYAYKAGNTDPAKPDAQAKYKVQEDGTATGEMSLYRGEYTLRLVSYNSATETPGMTDGTNEIKVENGRDFMYTGIEKLSVGPESAGATRMLVPLTTPFKRMGAQVQIRVRAKDEKQPITPTSLRVNNVKVEGLPETLSFPLGDTKWNKAENYEGAGFTYYSFANNRTEVREFRESNKEVLLPVDGTALLKFTVNLTVGYIDKETDRTLTKDYEASIQKTLLPGMKYVFDFTLTFYGDLKPSDLTLAVRGYYENELPSDEIGK